MKRLAPEAAPTRRIRVLHLIETLGRGGAEQLLAIALPRLVQAGFDVRIRALALPDSLLPDLVSGGVDAGVLFQRHTFRTRELAKAVRLVRKELAQHPVDILHTHLFNANLAGRLASMMLRSRPAIVTTLHNPDYTNMGPEVSLAEQRARWLVDWASVVGVNSKVIAVSNAVAHDFSIHMGRRGPWGSVEVIYNAIDVEHHIRATHAFDRQEARQRWGWRPGQLAVLSVGRLVRQKNYLTLIQSIERLRQMGIDARAIVFGDGPGRGDLRSRAGDNVHFHGLANRQEVVQALAACDVYVQTSRFEAFGIAILEAMASGRPVVASAVDGIPEVVDDGITGLLVPSLDARMFAERLRQLAEDPVAAARLGAAGRERARRLFSLETWVERTADLYRRVHRG